MLRASRRLSICERRYFVTCVRSEVIAFLFPLIQVRRRLKFIDAGPSLRQHLTTTISWDDAEALALDGLVAKILKQLDVDEG